MLDAGHRQPNSARTRALELPTSCSVPPPRGTTFEHLDPGAIGGVKELKLLGSGGGSTLGLASLNLTRTIRRPRSLRF